jgi:hypothetical protein
MRKKTKEEYIEIFNKKHNNYDYSEMSYVNNITKIKIICPKHGVFEMRPIDHRKSGCSKCQEIQLDDFLDRANELPLH